MVKVYSIEGVTPVVDPSAYVHPSACLIGDVIIGPECYIGPNACLRGDFGRIFIGKGANIQDCCIVHGFPERDTVVGENGHIGHGAVLHCCLIGRNALVGMNAVVMDKAEVGESSIVAAMAFVKAGMLVPPKTLVAGIPAKVVRALTEQEMAWKVEGTVLYQHLARRSLATMVETEALTEVEADRKRIILPEIKPLIEAKAEWAEAALEDLPE
ncbi:MAG: phenylacetic acid degradation protein PaaY [Betaproteobacteria bacterium HGW-Betaproteobacteria-14]|nr:MAG: phenylacetic acid degradation protein PaaY [Betaproteobacteria bacterium HGW-Betaproteobacteria-14]